MYITVREQPQIRQTGKEDICPKREEIVKVGFWKQEEARKNGQYIYQYTNSLDERKVIYNWKLVATDKVPAGKREDLSLREKIEEIERKLEQQLITTGQDMTVVQLV